MSRSGYHEGDGDNWSLLCWRGAVASSLRGKRGQSFLKELAAGLDAMSEKKLIADDLQHNGCFCALGVVGHLRGLDMSRVDPEDSRQVALAFGIAEAMAREIVWVNDEAGGYRETPEKRWGRMREWVAARLSKEPHHARHPCPMSNN